MTPSRYVCGYWLGGQTVAQGAALAATVSGELHDFSRVCVSTPPFEHTTTRFRISCRSVRCMVIASRVMYCHRSASLTFNAFGTHISKAHSKPLEVLIPAVKHTGTYRLATSSSALNRARRPFPTLVQNLVIRTTRVQQRSYATPKHRNRKTPPKKLQQRQNRSEEYDEAYNFERDTAWEKNRHSSQHEQSDERMKSRAEERLFADMIYVQLKDEARRTVRGPPISRYSFQEILQLMQTARGRERIRMYLSSVQKQLPGLMDAKRKCTSLTVFASLGDVSLGWRVGRVITFLSMRFFVGVARPLCSYVLGLLRSMDERDDASPKP